MNIPVCSTNVSLRYSSRGRHRTNILINFQMFAHQLNFSIRIFNQLSETLLNALNLLGHSTKDTLLQSIELVETSPRADLTQTDENPTHRLEVKGFVATENQDESTKLNAKGLHRLGLAWRNVIKETRDTENRWKILTSSSRPKWRAAKLVVQRLSQSKVDPVSKWSLHKSVRDTKILPSVWE